MGRFRGACGKILARPAARRLGRCRRTCAARRLHRPHLHHAAAVAGRIRPDLRGPWRAPRHVRGRHGEHADSRKPAVRADWRRHRACARHGACRPRLLSCRSEHRLCHAAWRTGYRRARRQHPAPHCLGAGRPRLCRPALADGARHLQFLRRYRENDGAGGAVVDAAGDAMAAGARHSGQHRIGDGGRDFCFHAAL